MEILSDNVTKIVLALIAILAAAATINVFIRINSRKNNRATIKNNTTGGDIAGRDIKKGK